MNLQNKKEEHNMTKENNYYELHNIDYWDLLDAPLLPYWCIFNYGKYIVRAGKKTVSIENDMHKAAVYFEKFISCMPLEKSVRERSLRLLRVLYEALPRDDKHYRLKRRYLARCFKVISKSPYIL